MFAFVLIDALMHVLMCRLFQTSNLCASLEGGDEAEK